jgi:hypothetical protein
VSRYDWRPSQAPSADGIVATVGKVDPAGQLAEYLVMLDPMSAANVLATLKLAKDGIELAWKHRRGVALAGKEQQAELERAYELATRVAGAILFELRSSTERLRLFVELGKKEAVPLSPFDFSISDRRIGELAEILPQPAIVDEFRVILAAAKRVDFFQRLANASPPVAEPNDGGPSLRDILFGNAIAFANDAIEKKVVERFNRLVEVVDGIGQAACGEGWPAVRDGFVPKPIDPSLPVDHNII